MTALVRVEVGAGDVEFEPGDVAEIVDGLRSAQRTADGMNGVVWRREPAPMDVLADLLVEGVREKPVPDGCTGHWDDGARLMHADATCPIHEEALSC